MHKNAVKVEHDTMTKDREGRKAHIQVCATLVSLRTAAARAVPPPPPPPPATHTCSWADPRPSSHLASLTDDGVCSTRATL